MVQHQASPTVSEHQLSDLQLVGVQDLRICSHKTDLEDPSDDQGRRGKGSDCNSIVISPLLAQTSIVQSPHTHGHGPAHQVSPSEDLLSQHLTDIGMVFHPRSILN